MTEIRNRLNNIKRFQFKLAPIQSVYHCSLLDAKKSRVCHERRWMVSRINSGSFSLSQLSSPTRCYRLRCRCDAFLRFYFSPKTQLLAIDRPKDAVIQFLCYPAQRILYIHRDPAAVMPRTPLLPIYFCKNLTSASNPVWRSQHDLSGPVSKHQMRLNVHY